MSELSKYPRHLGAAAAVVALGISGLACGGSRPHRSESTVQPRNQAAPPTPSPSPLHVEFVKGLAVGSKLGTVPVLKPTPKTRGKFDYAPKANSGNTQDLVAVYSPRLSGFMMESVVGDKTKKHSVAILLTDFPEGVLESLVIFDTKTQVVEAISLPKQLHPGVQALYDNVSPGEAGFTISVQPTSTTNGAGVELFVNEPHAPGSTASPSITALAA